MTRTPTDDSETNEKAGLNINSKKTECVIASKRGSPACKLQIGNVKIKQIQQF